MPWAGVFDACAAAAALFTCSRRPQPGCLPLHLPGLLPALARAPPAGTILTSAYQLFKQPLPDPEWATVVPHFRHLSDRERAAYDPEGTHTHGWFYTTFIT